MPLFGFYRDVGPGIGIQNLSKAIGQFLFMLGDLVGKGVWTIKGWVRRLLETTGTSI